MQKTTINKELDILDVSKQWLTARRKTEGIKGIEILPLLTSKGMTVCFYYEETGEDLPYFLTVPMVDELMTGKNPKRVRNEYKIT